jgi:FtsP/CotA-like multicopper oxidase with cupredoxin domain
MHIVSWEIGGLRFMLPRRHIFGLSILIVMTLSGCKQDKWTSPPIAVSASQSSDHANHNSHSQETPSTPVPNTGTPDSESLALTDEQVRAEDQTAMDLLHEKALEPVVLSDGTKQFTLTASAFPWHLYVGQTVQAWGFNGQAPGPLIRVHVGDHVKIVVHNQLPGATTVHWHGLAVPNKMDGTPMSQPPIQPGDTFVYAYTITPQMLGTHYYHSHVDEEFQVDSGMYGPMIVLPKQTDTTYDVDALYVLSSWKLYGMDQENAFTMNGKSYPETPMLHVKRGQKVRLRVINASGIESHTMHLHGYTFNIIALDGNPVARPQAANTITLGPGQTADVAFTADNPGDWMFHCHILDHMKNIDDNVDDMGGLVAMVHVE